MNGAQQVVGGLLAYCFSLITTGPLKSWQWLFLIYGVVSVFFGLFVGWWMPDSPMRAKCFTEQDKHLMVERLRSNQTGVQNRQFKWEQVKEALLDPQIWGYALVQLCTTLPTSGLGSFQGIIIKSFGFTTLQTQLLAMVLGFYIIFVLLTSVWLVKKTNQNLLVMLGFVIPYVGFFLFIVPISANCSIKLFYRDDLSSFRTSEYICPEDRSSHLLLYYPFVLECPNARALDGFSKHCWADKKECCV